MIPFVMLCELMALPVFSVSVDLVPFVPLVFATTDALAKPSFSLVPVVVPAVKSVMMS